LTQPFGHPSDAFRFTAALSPMRYPAGGPAHDVLHSRTAWAGIRSSPRRPNSPDWPNHRSLPTAEGSHARASATGTLIHNAMPTPLKQ
jgi:hypothetical protein